MRLPALPLMPLALLLNGCPSSTPSSPVTASIAYNRASGAAPLTVDLSGTASTSTNEGPLTYRWNFGDNTTSTDAAPSHTFQSPGRYVVQLTVTDSAGEEGKTQLEVRAAGTYVNAVISATPTTGTAPLPVEFDGSQYQADDQIHDYYWDFGDNSPLGRVAQPTHTYTTAGEFTVTLTIETDGGLKATSETTITVGQRNASLEFNGRTSATLPLVSARELGSFTYETWINADSGGGIAFSIAEGDLTVDLSPTSNLIGLQIGGSTTSITADFSGWRHIAVVYDADSTGKCVLYLDGNPAGNAPVSAALSIDRITIGVGLRGRMAEERLWSIARSGPAILSTRDQRLTGTETSLIDYWPCDEGADQTLVNRVDPLANGYLGSSKSRDSADPSWSEDGPPLD